MGDFKHNPGSGTLFVNTNPNPKAPKLSGQFTALDGKVWEIALWTATNQDGTPKTDRDGNKFFSVKVTEPMAVKPTAKFDQPPVDDDDLPF